jgi:3-phosphoshikimate 1-carboxyvinyltransferase
VIVVDEDAEIEVPRLAQPCGGHVRLPGSKSHANRAIVAACLADGATELTGATPCDDVALLVENLQRMGFALRWIDRDAGHLAVEGGIPREPPGAPPIELDCELAGTTLRFVVAVACLVPGEWVVTGNARMRERPIGPLVDALRGLGADASAAGGCPPVRVRGASLTTGGTTRVDASLSSQFVSALMLVAGALDGGLVIGLDTPPASAGYVALTGRVLSDFGARVEARENELRVVGPLRAPIGPYTIEGDWSAAGAFWVLNLIASSAVACGPLSADSAQADRRLPAILERMRAPGDLEIDASDIPDQVMNLAVCAAFRPARTRITGAANLRYKESDRLAVLTRELGKVGVRIDEHRDGVEVRGPTRIRPATLDPHGDHRMVMAFGVLGATADGIRILAPQCVSKSYPRFLDELRAVSTPERARSIAVIGMRGAGKTTLAHDLAIALGLGGVDLDTRFVEQHGPIAEFVAAHGWAEFRAREAAIVDELHGTHGVVLALGGGAVETPAVRRRLRDAHGPLVVWIQERRRALRERIARDRGLRPSLTGEDPVEEIDAVSSSRDPLYAELADFVLPPGLDRDERVVRVRDWLRSLASFDRSADGIE